MADVVVVGELADGTVLGERGGKIVRGTRRQAHWSEVERVVKVDPKTKEVLLTYHVNGYVIAKGRREPDTDVGEFRAADRFVTVTIDGKQQEAERTLEVIDWEA